MNPLVTVQVTRSSLPTFFSRIWGNAGNSVSATATAEAFNPSASDINTNGGATGTVIPVQPSCVKPWIVPNQDPCNPSTLLQYRRTTLRAFRSCPWQTVRFKTPASRPGAPNGVIGETFYSFRRLRPLASPVHAGWTTPRLSPMQTPQAQVPPNLEYLPACSSHNHRLRSRPVLRRELVRFRTTNRLWRDATRAQLSMWGAKFHRELPPNYIDLTENPASPAPRR